MALLSMLNRIYGVVDRIFNRAASSECTGALNNKSLVVPHQADHQSLLSCTAKHRNHPGVNH